MATAVDTVLTLQPIKYKLAGITVNFSGVAGVDTVKQTIKAPISLSHHRPPPPPHVDEASPINILES